MSHHADDREQSQGDQGDQGEQPADDSASEGQVSETAQMTPEGGDEGTPGTDDGVPPAADAGSTQDAPPEPYGEARHS